MATARATALRQGYTAKAAAGSFRAANHPRGRRSTAAGLSGDWHADELARRGLREISQDLARNANDYDTLLWRLVDFIGVPQLRESDDELGRQKAALWKAESESRTALDARGQSTFPQLWRLWCHQWLRDGDVFPQKLRSGHIHTWAGAQIDGDHKPGDNQFQRTRNGITLDRHGRWLKVWGSPWANWGGVAIHKAQAYEPDTFIPLIYRTDTSMTRGVPLIHAALDDVERIDSLRESEIISAEQASTLYGAITRQMGDPSVNPVAPPLAGGASAPIAGGSSLDRDSADGQVDEVDWVAGTYLDMPAGTKWETVKNDRPNLNVTAFLLDLIRSLCGRVGIAYELLFNDLRGLSWSTARSLVSSAKGTLGQWRQVDLEPFIRAIYEWRVRRWIEQDLLVVPSGADPFAHAWDWPDPEWPDPSKEAQAHELGFELGTTSRHRVVGPDWHSVLLELATEDEARDLIYVKRFAAIRGAIDKIRESDPGFDLDPREVLYRDTKSGPGGAAPAAGKGISGPQFTPAGAGSAATTTDEVM